MTGIDKFLRRTRRPDGVRDFDIKVVERAGGEEDARTGCQRRTKRVGPRRTPAEVLVATLRYTFQLDPG